MSRRLILPPTDESVSLSSYEEEGLGEEAAIPGSRSCPCLPPRLCPSPRPSPCNGERGTSIDYYRQMVLERVGGLVDTLPPVDTLSRFGNRRSAKYSRMRPSGEGP
jgi:hypothetical protein